VRTKITQAGHKGCETTLISALIQPCIARFCNSLVHGSIIGQRILQFRTTTLPFTTHRSHKLGEADSGSCGFR